ncbi:MAG: hypothetical protein JW791_03905 [Nanoarchaeota archaeon]|nr:hypothetical protein [Nanoarchaeota archaeon]
MAKAKKSDKVLFSDNIGMFFLVGATRALVVMFTCLVSMWLVSIFTTLIDMSIMVIVSAGVGIAFGTMRIFDLTLEEMSK